MCLHITDHCAHPTWPERRIGQARWINVCCNQHNFETASVNNLTSTYVSGTNIYPHMPILCPHTACTNGACLAWRLRWHTSTVMFTCGWAWPARWPIRPISASGGAKFPKMWDSLPWTPMNRRAKFDAASFILGTEIRSHTSTQMHTKQTNKHTHKQTVTLPIGMCGQQVHHHWFSYKSYENMTSKMFFVSLDWNAHSTT